MKKNINEKHNVFQPSQLLSISNYSKNKSITIYHKEYCVSMVQAFHCPGILQLHWDDFKLIFS